VPERWSIVVDRAACMGTGTCTVYAPGTLELDSEGKASPRTEPTDELDAVRAAIEACPTSALRLVDET
jgi:ferredoxin